MSKSARVRSRDLRQAFQLVAECRERGDDALEWNRHLFEGLSRLVGAPIAPAMEFRHDAAGRVVGCPFSFDSGWATAGQRSRWFELYVAQGGFRQAPTYQRFMALPGRLVTRNRRELVEDTEWHRSFELNETRIPTGTGDMVCSCVRLQDPTGLYGFVLNRPRGDRPFGPAESRLVHRLHQELSLWLGRVLILEPGGLYGGLARRLHPVLRSLVEGDSEKQVALRLALSRHTIHE